MATSNTIYIIDNTDGTLSFAIQPRTIDGANGVQRNTDLTLYGNAAPSWGERFNENFMKLAENFAGPAKAGSGNTPQDEVDYGAIGRGVNSPVTGQLWYNKDTDNLYVYTTSNNFKLANNVATTQPANPTTGDLWYDNPSLKIWNGGSWVASSVDPFLPLEGGTLSGPLILHSTSPASSLEAAAKGYVDDNFVPLVGDVFKYGQLSIAHTTGEFGEGNTLNLFTLDPGANNGPVLHMRMYEDFFVEKTPGAAVYQPMIEMHTPNNEPSYAGAGFQPYTRLVTRPGAAWAIELDDDAGWGGAPGANTNSSLIVYQTDYLGLAGTMFFNGCPDRPNNKGLIVCPNAEIADIGAGGGYDKALATAEYVRYENALAKVHWVYQTVETFGALANTGGNWQAYPMAVHGVPSTATSILMEFEWDTAGALSQLDYRSGSTWKCVHQTTSGGITVQTMNEKHFPISNGIVEFKIDVGQEFSGGIIIRIKGWIG